ncbi:hypothetical protein F7725_022749 [Dissostichus mawsoni]|uniref:Genetic suppressor element-like domain-containing protein n=1 Tax=Dissostichus mawsoni TaxID=36200 RepID=A0A7J5YYN7_DISMA|nr:hypothetical protein F7725_022749 [Dissostichus mawsoni]
MLGQRTEVRPGQGNVLKEVQIPPVELCPCDSGCGGVFCIPSHSEPISVQLNPRRDGRHREADEEEREMMRRITARVLHGRRGEKGEGAERENPLVAAGTGVSAFSLPQHASDRQMIEKERGRRRGEEMRREERRGEERREEGGVERRGEELFLFSIYFISPLQSALTVSLWFADVSQLLPQLLIISGGVIQDHVWIKDSPLLPPREKRKRQRAQFEREREGTAKEKKWKDKKSDRDERREEEEGARERVSQRSRKTTSRSSEREGMNHESNKSQSLGMISTATRTTATVSPLSPLTNGNAVAQSANSGFAAALRKLAKQAEDPRGSAISGESSPVSSPATSHSSPVSTPKRGSLGPLLGQTRGHGVPGTPPVVTIAPTKTSNGLWRADGRQVEPSVLNRDRVENTHPQQGKRTPPTHSPHHLAHHFGLTPSSVMQDPRIQSLSLPGQMHPGVPSGGIPEEYLRALRPFATSDDLRMASLPMSLDPAHAAHAAAAAAYYHPAYLHHQLYKGNNTTLMDESMCLSALRSQFYSVPGGGAFSHLHPSALHMHLPGGRYPGEMNHTAALAERLQMENELRQREREQEREREKEREREAGMEREREREREREEERERELDRQKERQRERQQQMVRAAESHYLAELQARRAPPEERPRPGERLTPNRLDKNKDSEAPRFPSTQTSVPAAWHSLLQRLHPTPCAQLGAFSPGEASCWLRGDPWSSCSCHDDSEGQRGGMVIKATRARAGEEGPLELGLRSPGKGVELRRDSHR